MRGGRALAGGRRASVGLAVALAAVAAAAPAVRALDARELEERVAERALVTKKVMVPMRDGVRLATDIYRPRHATTPLPTIFWRTPYNFNEMDGYRAHFIEQAMSRGYAFVIQNERGKFFSEGTWEILGRPRTDGWDALDWISSQPWSNGKVGTIGCSSSAEWQLALAAQDHPAHAAMVPMAAGAGIGRVGPFYEQGNWYRGGVFQMLFASWLYGVQNTQRPTFPADLSREDLERLSKYFDLAPRMPEVNWPEALRHLPLGDILRSVDGPKGIYSDLIRRKPDDPAWYEGGLYQDDEPWGVPALWMDSWYDVSVSPNLELYRIAQEKATDAETAESQYLVIAPTPHCAFQSASEHTIVGERDMGDARLDWDGLTFRFFDRFLKGEKEALRGVPKVRYYTMGSNEWQSAPTWPPPGVETVTWYLDGGGHANSLFGDGVLSPEPPANAASDNFSYDPLLPVPSLGGGVCCTGGAVVPGSFDQREIEARDDVLVYTSAPLDRSLEVTGPIGITLWVSSDARDTDFTVKLIDVYPDGRAFNVDETIQRARYREGYDGEVFFERGAVYELPVSAMATSIRFLAGHRIRVEISSSNFPRFARNLNTGGSNWDETEGVVARNTVHHSPAQPSQIRLPVVVSGRR